MKANQQLQQGFHVIEVAVIVLVVGVVGFVGYKVWGRSNNEPVANTSTTVPEIKTTKDLDKAETTVDQLETDDSSKDLDQLETELNAL